MHIGIDASSWGNNRGYGRYTRAILSELVRLDSNFHYTFFVDSHEVLDEIPTGNQVVLVNSSSPTTSAAASDGHRSISDMWRMSRSLSTPNIDILLFPTIYSYVPVFTPAKKLVVIHDVIPEMYPELTFPSRTGRLFWDIKTALGRWQADAIITVSNYSRQCLIDRLNIEPKSVYVVGEASDPVFQVNDQAELPPKVTSLGVQKDNRLITYVGGFGPHKNLLSLVSTFAELISQSEYRDVKLVMVGEYKREIFHTEIDSIQELIRKNEIDTNVVFTGYLSDEELVNLLNLSTALVLPSLMEGFGLPAVEAAACGCPVIATNESPLPELLGDGGLYVDPRNPNELRLALESVLSSDGLQNQMRAAGLKAVQSLTWKEAAHQLMEVINQVVIQ